MVFGCSLFGNTANQDIFMDFLKAFNPLEVYSFLACNGSANYRTRTVGSWAVLILNIVFVQAVWGVLCGVFAGGEGLFDGFWAQIFRAAWTTCYGILVGYYAFWAAEVSSTLDLGLVALLYSVFAVWNLFDVFGIVFGIFGSFSFWFMVQGALAIVAALAQLGVAVAAFLKPGVQKGVADAKAAAKGYEQVGQQVQDLENSTTYGGGGSDDEP